MIEMEFESVILNVQRAFGKPTAAAGVSVQSSDSNNSQWSACQAVARDKKLPGIKRFASVVATRLLTVSLIGLQPCRPPPLLPQWLTLEDFGQRCVVADNPSKAAWSLGCVSAIDRNGGTILLCRRASQRPAFRCASAEEKLRAFGLESRLAARSMMD